MSQHYFDTKIQRLNLPVSVLAGWDYPCQKFFLVVERNDETSGDQRVYSNLNDRNQPDGKNWQYYLNKLDEIGIEIPSEMSEAVVTDSERQVRNKITIWDKNGAKRHIDA